MLRTAIFGAGHWGRRLIESVQGRSTKIGFVTAVTRDPAGQRALAERFGLALTDSAADVLADPGIDAVVLATPHSRHADEIVAAAQGRQARVRGKAVHPDARRCRARDRGLPGGRRHAACRLQPPLRAGLCRDGAADRARRDRRAAPCRGQFLRAGELPDRAGQLARQPGGKPGRQHDRARRARARQHGEPHGPGGARVRLQRAAAARNRRRRHHGLRAALCRRLNRHARHAARGEPDLPHPGVRVDRARWKCAERPG